MGRIQFLLRCMFRHKLRTTLTMLSLVTAFLLFVMLRSVAVVFETGWVDFEEVRLTTQSKYSMIELLPLSHQDTILSIDGVVDITHASWFGGIFEEGETGDATFAVDPESYFDVYSEYVVDPDQLEEFKTTRTAALAPQSLIDKYGWEIGQKIPVISPIFPNPAGGPFVFDLVGSYSSTNEGNDFLAFLFHYEYLTDTFAFGSVGWYMLTIDDPERADEIAREIDSRFENSSDETRSMTESESFRQFASQIGDISLMVTGILSAVFFTMILLTANTMVQGYRERISELAVMKTLGFSNSSVSAYILAEAMLMCTLSAAVGIGIGILVVLGVQEYMPPMIPIYFDPVTCIWAGAIAVGLGVFVGSAPAINANRLVIVDALYAH